MISPALRKLAEEAHPALLRMQRRMGWTTPVSAPRSSRKFSKIPPDKMREIAEVVSRRHGFCLDQLIPHQRNKSRDLARFEVMWTLCRQRCSRLSIGRLLLRDSKAVENGVRRWEAHLANTESTNPGGASRRG